MSLQNLTFYTPSLYGQVLDLTVAPEKIYLGDHLGGFDANKKNILLDHLHGLCADALVVYHDQVPTKEVRQNYPKIDFVFELYKPIWDAFTSYKIHPQIDYKKFLCCWNGSPHVSRKLLVSVLNKFLYFDPDYCSKHFSFSNNDIEGHLSDFLNEEDHRFYIKFFRNAETFNQEKYSFDRDTGQPYFSNYQHHTAIYALDKKITECFLHLVSETMATSYVPFVSEKFLYSVVTRGLFITYAQPGWHDHLCKYYGFKKYEKLFDYKFDTIQNPIERLLDLMTMISKFDKLSPSDWHDLHLLQRDEIEYNYDHYFSKDYLKYTAHYE